MYLLCLLLHHVTAGRDFIEEDDHPSVFLDDSTFSKEPDAAPQFDSPSLSPISGLCDSIHEPNEDSIDHVSQRSSQFETSNESITQPSLFNQCVAFLYAIFSQIRKFFFPSSAFDGVSQRSMSHSRGKPQNFPIHQFDYDSCVLSIYSPDIISHLIDRTEAHANILNTDFQPNIDSICRIDIPSNVFSSSIQSSEEDSDQRLLALLKAIRNPMHEAAELSSTGVPHMVHFIESSSITRWKDFWMSRETIDEVCLSDSIDVSPKNVPNVPYLQYTTLGHLKEWMESDDPEDSYESLLSAIKMIDIIEINEAIAEKAYEMYRNNDKENESSTLNSLANECIQRYGAAITPQSNSVGVFMVPHALNHLLWKAVRSFFSQTTRLTQSPSETAFFAQEFSVVPNANMTDVVKHRQKYLFRVRENSTATILLSCPMH